MVKLPDKPTTTFYDDMAEVEDGLIAAADKRAAETVVEATLLSKMGTTFASGGVVPGPGPGYTHTYTDPDEEEDDMPTATTEHPDVINRKGGTGAYGLFVNYVVYTTETGKLLREDRYFLYQDQLSRYSRKNGTKRANWRARKYESPEKAREELIREIERRATYHSYVRLTMIHRPLLVELTTADIEAYRQGESPGARHTAVSTVEKAVGKIDDETWRAP